ncbi:hypothetical protein IFR04_008506 [Cadophora malorum]|uniref:CENP-V/GFA domain-containing protein n=1 Tax=Cadophora malorum TaxID=108018 RepID=A0A8H7WAK9_9HELO|nr:hypothetical protein IFR04_008506 [Cadophora malorum]
MPALPETAFQLKGGCFCSAIRYTISIPELEARPKIPNDPKKEIFPPKKVSERLPMITLDHCTSCRRIGGTIIESWFICPQAWVQFTLQNRCATGNPASTSPDDSVKPTMMEYLMPDRELQEKTYLTYFSSSEDVNRTFCGKCGTHLTYYCSDPPAAIPPSRLHWGPYFDVAGGTLDREFLEIEGYRPNRYGWAEDGISWVKRLLREGERSLME